VRAEAFAEETRLSRMRFPRFRRMAVGRRSRTSFEKPLRRVEGERDVVTRIRGSDSPDRRAYSSSISSSSSLVSPEGPGVGRDSSYLKSSRRRLSLATLESDSGFPDEREDLRAARFSAIEACWRVRARL
jgi:hypothetical protein